MVYRDIAVVNGNSGTNQPVFIIDTAIPQPSTRMFKIVVDGYGYEDQRYFNVELYGYTNSTGNVATKTFCKWITNPQGHLVAYSCRRTSTARLSIVIGFLNRTEILSGSTYYKPKAFDIQWDYVKVNVKEYWQMYGAANSVLLDYVGWTITPQTHTNWNNNTNYDNFRPFFETSERLNSGNLSIGGFDSLSNQARFEVYAPSNNLLKHPPANMTSDSHNQTGQTYGNGLYLTSTSSTGTTGNEPWRAFDGNTGTFYRSATVFTTTTTISGDVFECDVSNNISTGYNGIWLKLESPQPIRSTQFTIRSVNSADRCDPYEFRFYGSHDNTTWVHINSQTFTQTTMTANTVYTYNTTNTAYYMFYALVVNKIRRIGTGIDVCEINEFQINALPRDGVRQIRATTDIVELSPITGRVGVRTTNPNSSYAFHNASTSLLTGGAKITIQGAVDGGNSRGIFMWQETDTNWGIYMAQSGASKSLSGGTAPIGVSGQTNYSIRFRAGNSTTTTQGFIFENGSNNAVVAIRSSDGMTWINGNLGVGNNNPTNKLDVSGNAVITGTITEGTQLLSAKYAPISHTHTIANITGLQTALDGKAPTSHTHTIANITGLQTSLDGKLSILGGTIGPSFATMPMSEVLYVKNGKLTVDGTISEQGTLLVDKYALKTENPFDISGTNVYLSDPSYNLGLGFDTPSYKLDVQGDVRVFGTSLFDTCEIRRRTTNDFEWAQIGHTASMLSFMNGNDGYGLLLGQAGRTILNSSGDRDIEFRHNNTTNAVITSTGRLGIGTVTPTRMLHLSGVAQYIRIQDTQGTGKSSLVGQDANSFNVWTNNNTTADSGWSEIFTIRNATGNVGIRQSNPTQTQHITNGDNSKTLYGPNTTWSSFLEVGAGGDNVATNRAQVISTNGNLHLDCGSAREMYLNFYSGRNILCGDNVRLSLTTTAPVFKLQLPNIGSNSGGRGQANAWVTYSDDRIKTEEVEIPYGLNDVMKMKPSRYLQHNSRNDESGNLIIDEEGSYYNIGFIAQELLSVIPEAVSVPEDEEKNLYSVDYPKLVPVLTKAIQELNHKVKTLKTENDELKSRMDAIHRDEERMELLETSHSLILSRMERVERQREKEREEGLLGQIYDMREENEMLKSKLSSIENKLKNLILQVG
jgi:hypothetical protein